MTRTRRLLALLCLMLPMSLPISARGNGADPEDEVWWQVAETAPGMYRLEFNRDAVRIARQGNNPGGLQNGGLKAVLKQPLRGDFEARVNIEDARIQGGGLNQIELQAGFADGTIFFVVRDRDGAGSHVWAPGVQGNAACGNQAVLRLKREAGFLTGYCNDARIWSAQRGADLTSLRFVLQNNGGNDPISVTFRDWSLRAGAPAVPPTWPGRDYTSRIPAAPAPAAVEIAELEWLGVGEDKVGDWGNGQPNGAPDAHLRLTLDGWGSYGVSAISLWSATERGEKAGGQVWHSQASQYWMLGVFRYGTQINASHISEIGSYSGRTVFDLYANSSGWFNPGQWFLLEVTTTDGRTLSKSIQMPRSSGAAAPPASVTVDIAELEWVGVGEDKVGDWGNGRPNGVPDARLRLVLDAWGKYGLSSLSLWSANERGEKAGGQVWHTQASQYWNLGVFQRGAQLNNGHVARLGDFTGRAVFDLYANSSGWFNPGQWFLVEAVTADGQTLRKTIQMPQPGFQGGRDYSSRIPAAPQQAAPSEPARKDDKLKDGLKKLKDLFKL